MESSVTKVGVSPIEDKMRETRLRWFRHVINRVANASPRRCVRIILKDVGGDRGRGRPKKN